jgi:hypothetical protein
MIQLLEEIEPYFLGQILSYIACTAEVAAVLASKITPVSNGHIYGYRGFSIFIVLF